MRGDYRRQYHAFLKDVQTWRDCTGCVMETSLGDGHLGTAAIFGWSKFEHILAETPIRKAFELAGMEPRVLTDPTPEARVAYAALGMPRIETFLRYCPLPDGCEAAALMAEVMSFEELIALRVDNVAVGKYVSSSLMRRARKGYLELSNGVIRNDIEGALAMSIAYVRGAQRMLEVLRPRVVVLVDRGYSPFGEVFDVCIDAAVPVVTWNVAHRDNVLMFKRYNRKNWNVHPSSLSDASWRQLMDIPWGDEQRHCLQRELAESYTSGEWYGEVGTQFGKRAWKREEIVERLGLNSTKKTAVVFSHIFWDATFFWGEDLFRDYEEWFVETVKAACCNDRLNWLIKIHPANMVKDRRDGVQGDPSEIVALRERVGKLPDHVNVIPADADLTTLSLFSVMDYCLTVRGTVGIEAALLGKTVLTAGTGRYNGYGFTVDFSSSQDYLAQLAVLEQLGPPTPLMRERAERYGYGVFLCRPLRLECFRITFKHDQTATLVAECLANSVEALRKAPELNRIAAWLATDEEDLLVEPKLD